MEFIRYILQQPTGQIEIVFFFILALLVYYLKIGFLKNSTISRYIPSQSRKVGYRNAR